MKIIITEDMLKYIVNEEIKEDRFDNRTNYSGQGFDNKQWNYPFSNNNQTFQSPVKQAVSNPTNYNMGQNFNGQMIGNWNVGKSIQWIMANTSNDRSGNCAKYVEDAIAAGGLPRMNCRENGGDGYAHSLHSCGTLKKHGFVLIDSGKLNGNSKYNGNLQTGDIMILDTYVPRKNHAAMWTGSQWISDFKQNNANVYSIPADFWIYRYNGGNVKA